MANPKPGQELDANELRTERDTLARRVAEMQSHLDEIEGLVTNQPGEDPTGSDEVWSVAFEAVKDRINLMEAELVLTRRDADRLQADNARLRDLCREAADLVERSATAVHNQVVSWHTFETCDVPTCVEARGHIAKLREAVK